MITAFVNVLLVRSDNLSTQYAALSCACGIEVMSNSAHTVIQIVLSLEQLFTLKKHIYIYIYIYF